MTSVSAPDEDTLWFQQRIVRLIWTDCPYCAAEPGEPCITTSGQDYPPFHAKRWKLTRDEPMENYDPVKTQLSVSCYMAETEPFKADGREFAEALDLGSLDFSRPANAVRAMMHRDCLGHVVVALNGAEFDCGCPCHFPGLPEEEFLHLDASNNVRELSGKYPIPESVKSDELRNKMRAQIAALSVLAAAAEAQRQQTLGTVLKLAAALGSEEAVLLVARQLENETYDEGSGS